ncbi:MAG: O-antigen ligase family protein [Terriglobia bacterium]
MACFWSILLLSSPVFHKYSANGDERDRWGRLFYWSQRLELRLARGALIALLLAAPLALGAVQGWAWASIGVLASVLLIVWSVGASRESTATLVWSPLFIPAAGMLLLGAIQLLARRTLDPAGTREALVKLAADVIIFFLALQIFSAPRKARRGQARDSVLGLGPVLTVYAFALAVFAILQWTSSHGLIYWGVKTEGWVFGPYVNHNHYAGLMERLIPVVVIYALTRPKNRTGNTLLAFMILFPVASVLLSGSRGGCIALAAESLLLVGAIAWRSSGGEGRRHATAGLMLAIALAALLGWLSTGATARRLATLGGLARSPSVTLGQRLSLAHDALHLFRERPRAGTGLGSFAVAFPRVQSFPSDAVYEHAHSDFLEALAETGVAGGLLIALALILFLRDAFGNLRAKLACDAGWIRFGAAVGCCGLLVHSLADFNLHIPANAAWFAFLLGVASCPEGNTVISHRLKPCADTLSRP